MPKTITDYHRLPLTDWFYSIEHSKLSPGIGYIYIYIPDSTNYKSTASGAKNLPYSYKYSTGETLKVWFARGAIAIAR